RARFPHATVVSIAVRWTTRAQVLDVETGNATPAQAVTWCTKTMADKPNTQLTIYCNSSVWPQVRAAFKAAGVTEPNYWVAQYDNDPTIPAGAVAKQYQGDTHGYDKSVVADYWPGVDPPPLTGEPQWLKLLAHILAVPEGIYEHWVPGTGWDNHTVWGVEYGEDGVPYCVIGAWDEFHECGLDSAVPKTDNVNDFAAWARAHGEWSEYPSIGAWMDVGDGAHCEVVLGFTATTVLSKGWNSVQSGATDSGQGNGVWTHVNARTDPRITGYLAPRFPDNICPPTADPHDPRGGTAVTSYSPPEDLMAITDADADKIALAVLKYKNANALKANPNLPDVYGYIVGTNGAMASLTAQVGALSGAITALTKAGGITAEQVTAAAQAGAKAALEELATALTKAGA
ncbi:MAG TPA: hypothetical protein VN088_21350, partial [Nocardioides sp.]|nr:hypothetical protein [Nocardioides sp.]